ASRCRGVRPEWVSHPLRASAVRASDRTAQGDRVAPLHDLVRRQARSSGPAEAVRVARDARSRTVRVLVTGATGFTGGHLARALVAAGHEVSALIRDRAGEPAVELARAGITPVSGDLRDPSSLTAATTGVQVVYHVAAIYRQAGVPADTYRAVNALGSQL